MKDLETLIMINYKTVGYVDSLFLLLLGPFDTEGRIRMNLSCGLSQIFISLFSVYCDWAAGLMSLWKCSRDA